MTLLSNPLFYLAILTWCAALWYERYTKKLFTELRIVGIIEPKIMFIMVSVLLVLVAIDTWIIM